MKLSKKIKDSAQELADLQSLERDELIDEVTEARAERDEWRAKAEALAQYLRSMLLAEHGEGDSDAAVIGRQILDARIRRERTEAVKPYAEIVSGFGVCADSEDGEIQCGDDVCPYCKLVRQVDDDDGLDEED